MTFGLLREGEAVWEVGRLELTQRVGLLGVRVVLGDQVGPVVTQPINGRIKHVLALRVWVALQFVLQVLDRCLVRLNLLTEIEEVVVRSDTVVAVRVDLIASGDLAPEVRSGVADRAESVDASEDQPDQSRDTADGDEYAFDRDSYLLG